MMTWPRQSRSASTKPRHWQGVSSKRTNHVERESSFRNHRNPAGIYRGLHVCQFDEPEAGHATTGSGGFAVDACRSSAGWRAKRSESGSDAAGSHRVTRKGAQRTKKFRRTGQSRAALLSDSTLRPVDRVPAEGESTSPDRLSNRRHARLSKPRRRTLRHCGEVVSSGAEDEV